MTLMDFAVLPPEVNSGRIYAGPRSGPLMAAAAAWDGLAAELSLATASYRVAVSDLTDGSWHGPSASAMAAAAAPYVEWMGTTAAQAEQAANQARAAAAAYEAAFAATVPPPVIATNRTLLASLVASNVLGQNTPAIAANQAEYAEMWAQDATAMYGYAASSAVATQLTPFTAPVQNTNPAGASAQAAASAQAGLSTATNTAQTLGSAAGANALPSWLDQLLNFNLATTQLGQDFLAVNGSFSGFQAVVGGLGYTASGSMFTIVPGVNAAIAASGAMTSAMAAVGAVPVSAVTVAPGAAALGSTLAGTYAGSSGLAGAGMSAGMAQAGSVGGLSVPPSWATSAPSMATASPGVRLASAALPNAGVGAPGAGMAGAGPMMGGMPMLAGGVNAPRTGEANSRFGSRLKVLPHVGGESGAQENPSTRWTQPSQPAAKAGGKFTERDELKELRRAVAELAKERDVLHSAAVSLLKEATQR